MIASRELSDGRWLFLYRMLPGQVRLCIGPPVEEGYYDDAWCFHGEDEGRAVLDTWDGASDDPPGRWYRHIGSGRRREFDEKGKLMREYVLR